LMLAGPGLVWDRLRLRSRSRTPVASAVAAVAIEDGSGTDRLGATLQSPSVVVPLMTLAKIDPPSEESKEMRTRPSGGMPPESTPESMAAPVFEQMEELVIVGM
jgi:hypothetical protein